MRSIIILLCITVFSGCVSYEELVNFDELAAGRGSASSIDNYLELKIQSNDLLRIEIETADADASAPFNEVAMTSGVGQMSTLNLQLMTGYLVDQDGFVDLPLLGRLEAAGQTLESLQFLIRGKLTQYIVNPVVNVRYLNFKVTVLGEVNIPGVLTLPNSRVTILEALGMAGDMTDYADRSSLLVVREQDGVRSYQRLDLHSDEIFSSDYYYLRQNDVIYINPIKARTATVADPGQRVVSYLTAFVAPVLSVAGIIIALTINKN